MLTPIIVLGLGGIGSEIVKRLEKKVKEMNLESRALFAVIDTDINTMNRIQQEGFEGTFVQISKNMTVKEYLNQYEQAKDWFSETEGLNIKSMTEGAGQVRAISRLAFDVAVRNGSLNGLEEKIRHLFQITEREEQQAPRILVVSSLAGGTGSGIVMPLALYMRRYFEEVLHIRTVIIKGMFIMPDVFKDIIGNNFEQVSIEANAYAAIKELEAFNKKGEGYLAENYARKMHLKLPIVASDKVEEYSTLPYNYCYLFGGKNIKGNSLRSFQDYLNYAVECIYAQAFSPMQELNNSIEDNVFRIASTGIGQYSKEGVKRFCSAGIAVLEYPYEDIVRMLALKKAGMILSEQWSLIDGEYLKECIRQEELRTKGVYVSNQTKSTFYIEYVEGQKEGNIFAKKIYMDTVRGEKDADENFSPKESWILYWENIEEVVKKWLLPSNSLKELQEQVCESLKAGIDYRYHRIKNEITVLKDDYEELIKQSKEELEKKRSVVNTKFFGKRMEEEKGDGAYYETWLKKEGNFIHPNAIRFFLYQAIKMFREKQEVLKQRIVEEDKALKESLDRASDKLDLFPIGFLNDLFYRGEVKKIYNKISSGMQVLKQYQEDVLLEQIAIKGCELFEKLSEEYEAFYKVFDYNVQKYAERRMDIEQRIQNVTGTIKRYVCCDQKSLKRMEDATIDVHNDVEIAGEISELIYRSISENCDFRKNLSDYHSVFQDILIQHWEMELKEKYNYILDKDILDALAQEYMYVSGNEVRNKRYIEDKMESMWNIASPFMGISDASIGLCKNFCTYNACLEKKKDYIRNELIQMLKDSGGTADMEDAINQYTIIFYKVIYGLAPHSLKEMSIVWDESKKDFNMGNISKSYYQMLQNAKYSKMTPHIDWNWNRFDIMPDFNIDFQEYLENITYQMFMYKCAMDLTVIIDDEDVLRYSMIFNKKNKYSTTLHEILIEYFIKDLSMVTELQFKVEKEIHDWIREGKKREEFPFLASNQSWGMDPGGIFEVICCVSIDGGVREYHNSILGKMVNALVDLLWNILRRFYEDEKARVKLKDLIFEQWKKYKDRSKNAVIKNDIGSALREKLREINCFMQL